MAHRRSRVGLAGFATGKLASFAFALGLEPVLEPVLELAHDEPVPAPAPELGPALGPEPALHELRTLVASVGQSFGAVVALARGKGSCMREGPWYQELLDRRVQVEHSHL